MPNLCEVCRSIQLRPPTLPLKPIRDALLKWDGTTGPQSSSLQIYAHHSSFQFLQESANSGCPLCTLLVTSLLDADVLLGLGPSNWGGIMLVWYRTSIELEYKSSRWGSNPIEPVHITESCPDQWDELEVRVRSTGCLSPGKLSAITALDNGAASYITGRSLPAFDSDATYQTIQGWINTCCQHHSSTDCPCHIDEILPTRIIDVGSSHDSVVSLNVSTNMRGTYIALSHVWGAQIHNKLEMKLLEKWRGSIDVRLLPRSFQDAITVTRKLGLRYIWIDALCIVQDSPKDWQRESSKMGSVFKNAFLTIAVSATAQSPDGFLIRKPRYDSSCKLELLSTRGESCGHAWVKPQASPKGKIDSRAWCLQENVLSTRVLTFASEECFFQCRKKYRVSESGVYSFQDSRYLSTGGGLIQYLSWAANEFQNSERLDKSRRERICHSIARLWYAMIGDSDDHVTRSGYGNRHLTHTSDKLPALSGLAHEVHRIIQCQYLAGIWECNLVGGLLWRNSRVIRPHSGLSASGTSIPQKLGDPDAPSWSWAASNGPLKYPYPHIGTQSTDVINIIDSGTTLAGSDPMGRVSTGWITLNGPISEIRCIRDRDNASYLVTSLGTGDLSDEAKKGRKVIANVLTNLGMAPAPENHIGAAIFDDDDYFSSSVTCLLFYMPNTNLWACGLMLQSTGRDGEYRRVGLWQATETGADFYHLWAGFNRRTITLI